MPNTFRTPMSCRGLLVATAVPTCWQVALAPGAVIGAPAAAVLTRCKAEDAVRVRAQQRWDWLVTGEYEDFHETYHTRFSGTEHGARIPQSLWHRCQLGRCSGAKRGVRHARALHRAGMRRYAVGGAWLPGTITTSVVETWLLEEGQWCVQAP